METLWFVLLAWMLATYVVLDGFDLGVGVLHLIVAKSEGERAQVLRSVGPVWDGNEVWLLAAAGTMFFAFPRLLATSFSGFYLPLMIVLWLLVFRALAIELRHQLQERLWTHAWDVAFAAASTLLVVCFGAALGNVVRGVPLDEGGTFFEPLWTDFRVGEVTGILDGYTLLVGVTAVAALAHHGALWLAAKTDGALAERAGRSAGRLWAPVLALTVLTTAATFFVQPHIAEALRARPWGAVFPALAAAGLAGAALFRRRRHEMRAFLASALFLYGMIASAAVGIYPYVLPGRDPAHGLTVYDVATSPRGLTTGLAWWIPGMLLVTGYFVFVYRRMPAKFSISEAADL